MNEGEFKSGSVKAEKPKVSKPKAGNAALKDHIIFSPPSIPEPIEIKKGDDMSKHLAEIPESFHQSLITEGVMKG